MASHRHTYLLLAGLYLLIAVFMTWPLLRDPIATVPGGVADLWQNYWNLWWWKTALLAGDSPYTTDRIFFPGETRLGLHTHSPANMLGTLPLNILFGVPAALDLATFAGFVLAGVGACLLAREYTSRWLAAFPAGLVFAYFPQHVEQALEHLNLASYYGLPFFLWSLVRTIRTGGRWWVATGLLFALNALLAWHNALLAIVLGLAVGIFETWHSSRPRLGIGLDLARAAFLALVVMGPFLWPLVTDSLAATGTLQKRFSPRAIDPISFVVPHREHPLWGDTLAATHDAIGSYRTAGGVGYLGWTSLILAAGVLLRPHSDRPRQRTSTTRAPRGCVALWTALFLFFLSLTLGDSLDSESLQAVNGLTMPYHWVRAVPLFGLVRIANRFLVPAMLALSVLVAMGGERWLTRIPLPRRSATTAAIALLVLLDLAWIPFPMQRLPTVEWLPLLEREAPELAVLDIPSGIRKWSKADLYLQTRHGRRIATGFSASTPRRIRKRLSRYPALRQVLFPFPSPTPQEPGPIFADSVRQLGIGLVVVHLDRTRESLQAARRQARSDSSVEFGPRQQPRPGFGMREDRLDEIRSELRNAFGPPSASTDEVEIYRVGKPDGS